LNSFFWRLLPELSLRTPRLTLIIAGIVLVRLATLPTYPILDKSEARYAYIGELMVQTGNWITPFIDHNVPFWAKPILSFWLTATSLSLFGFNAFAARLPYFLIFCAVGFLIFILGRDTAKRDFGIASACIFASSALGFYFGGTIMTDPVLMLGTTLVMTSFWKCMTLPEGRHRGWGYLFFVGVAVGLLAKGPIGAILPGMSIVVWITQHRRWGDTWRRLPWVAGTVLTLLLVLPWYALAEHRTPGFLNYFLIGEHFERYLTPHWEGDLYGAGRPQPKGTIWLFGLIAGLPWSVVMLGLLFRRRARAAVLHGAVLTDPWLSYLILWLLAPLILFTFAANTLISYVAPSLPAFALLVAHALHRVDDRLDLKRFVVGASVIPVLFLATVVATIFFPRMDLLRSQKAIVAKFDRITSGQSARLIYFVNKPYSADFYSGGRATLIRKNEEAELEAALGDKKNYFVIATDIFANLPERVREKVEPIVERNHYVLAHASAPSHHPTTNDLIPAPSDPTNDPTEFSSRSRNGAHSPR
jgi:4-amino-4-deoxy-L-arabinose transferase-like glycosyltransferase